MTSIIQVELPASLCLLAGIRHRVQLSITGPITQRTVLDRLEANYPMLEGTIRDHTTGRPAVAGKWSRKVRNSCSGVDRGTQHCQRVTIVESHAIRV